MTLPRRGPVTDAQRLKTLSLRTEPRMLGGRTRNALPVAAGIDHSARQVGRGGGGVIARAMFEDPSASVAFGANADPSVLLRSDGPFDAFFAYDSGGPGVLLLQAGWYMIACTCEVDGATAGDVIRCYANLSTPETAEAIDIADSSGSAHPKVVMLPFFDDGTGTIVGTSTINQTGSSGLVAHPSVILVAFGMQAS